MVALLGFDTFVGAAEVLPPLSLSQVLIGVTLPAKVTVGGIDVDSTELDGAAAPTLAIDIGDAADIDRFVAASLDPSTATLLEYRPAATGYYRYSAVATVTAAVQALPTSAIPGTIAMTVYGYQSLDLSDAKRMVLQAMVVLAEGETPRAQDAALAEEALLEVHETLRGKGLANRYDLTWPVTLIPAFAGRPYARMAGNLLADTFGLPAQRAQWLAQRAAEAEREMRRQTQVKTTGQPVSLDPYQAPPSFVLDLGVLG